MIVGRESEVGLAVGDLRKDWSRSLRVKARSHGRAIRLDSFSVVVGCCDARSPTENRPPGRAIIGPGLVCFPQKVPCPRVQVGNVDAAAGSHQRLVGITSGSEIGERPAGKSASRTPSLTMAGRQTGDGARSP